MKTVVTEGGFPFWLAHFLISVVRDKGPSHPSDSDSVITLGLIRLQWGLGMVVGEHPRWVAVSCVQSLSFHGGEMCEKQRQEQRFSPPLL